MADLVDDDKSDCREGEVLHGLFFSLGFGVQSSRIRVSG